MPADLNYRKKLERTKKWLDIVVYSSSALDAAIAIVALLSFLHLGNPNVYIWPISYALATMVALTVALGALLIWLKHYEKIIYNLAMFHTSTIKTFSLLNKMINSYRWFGMRFKYNYQSRNSIFSLRNWIRKLAQLENVYLS